MRRLSQAMVACLAAWAAGAGELPAFPGAEGFGRFASGGRGGEVCEIGRAHV